MDMMPTTTPTPTTTTTPKSPELESETPTRIQPAKPISFSNGIIKRHHPLLFTYKECLKNHAAALGGHALDGCGEFMPSPSSISSDPTSLKCAACGCHRNFHRRDPDDSSPSSAIPPPITAIEYHPHHRHHPPPPPPPPGLSRSPNSASPPPISSSYMLLALSGTNNNPGNNNLPFSDLNFSGNNLSTHHHHHHPPGSRKRFRTKFSQFQKEKMQEFAERVGWKMQKRDEDDIRDFCRQIGVDRGVLKVWMHNNKNTFNRRENPFSVAGTEIPKITGDDTTNDEYTRDEASGGGGRGLGHDLHHSVSSGGGGGFDSDSGGANGGNANGSSSS